MARVNRFSREWGRLQERWASDLVTFVREAFRREPHSQQLAILEAIQAESELPYSKRLKRFTVVSAQGGGKTALLTWVALWRQLRHKGTLTAISSPTLRQVKQFFAEATRMLDGGHPVLQRYTKSDLTKITMGGIRNWEILGMTATSPGKLAGLHQTYLSYLLDEANEMARPLIQTVEGTLTNQDSILMKTGNPIQINNALHDDATRFRNLVHLFHIDRITIAKERPKIISPESNEKLIEQYGIDSDFVRVRIFGKFPNKANDAVMGIDDIMECVNNDPLVCAARTDVLPENRAFGLDFARLGGDHNVMAQRQGLATISFKKWIDMEPEDLVAQAYNHQNRVLWDNRDTLFNVDAGGVGQGVLANFHRNGRRMVAIQNHMKALDQKMYANIVSQAWWEFGILVAHHLIHIPDDPRLIQQLSSRKYEINQKGQIQLQSKKEWKKAVEQETSPDEADAIVLAFFSPQKRGSSLLRLDKQRVARRM